MGSSTTAESQAISLIEESSVTEAKIAKIFDSLKPLPSREFLIGSWEGGAYQTGHPGCEELIRTRWAGKDFRGVDDVDPIIVFGDDGKRVWDEEWGHASLREMVFRGTASTAMIYDDKPIFDHFRYVNEDLVMGVMDSPKMNKAMGTEMMFYFYLKRRKES